MVRIFCNRGTRRLYHYVTVYPSFRQAKPKTDSTGIQPIEKAGDS